MRSINIKSSIKNYKINFTSSLIKDLNKISRNSDIYLIDRKVFKLHRLEKNINSNKILLIDANEKSKSFEKLDKVIRKILAINFKKKP